jgi:hypothetical protein
MLDWSAGAYRESGPQVLRTRNETIPGRPGVVPAAPGRDS